MSVPEWIVGVLGIVADLVRGVISHDDAKTRMAEYAAIDLGVDELERRKLGEGQ